MRLVFRSQVVLAFLLLFASPAQAQSYVEETLSFAFDDPIAAGVPAIPLLDEEQVAVSLPWSIPFYGSDYNALSVSDNGALRFK